MPARDQPLDSDNSATTEQSRAPVSMKISLDVKGHEVHSKDASGDSEKQDIQPEAHGDLEKVEHALPLKQFIAAYLL